jgi:hypothetical protein
MAEAYSDEVSSCGSWPDGAAEGTFYPYAYPEPQCFGAADVAPAEAYFDQQRGEFVLPYAAVRTARDPVSTCASSSSQHSGRLAILPAARRSGLGRVQRERWHETYNDFPGPDVVCGHLVTIAAQPAPADAPDACLDCLAEGTTWVELRKCLVCGQIRCCESSPRRHTTAHFQQT